jgi:hypothetical protein
MPRHRKGEVTVPDRPPVPAGPLDQEPIGYRPSAADLRDTLAAADVTLGTYDERIVTWLADTAGWGVTATITSWIQRANQGRRP